MALKITRFKFQHNSQARINAMLVANLNSRQRMDQVAGMAVVGMFVSSFSFAASQNHQFNDTEHLILS